MNKLFILSVILLFLIPPAIANIIGGIPFINAVSPEIKLTSSDDLFSRKYQRGDKNISESPAPSRNYEYKKQPFFDKKTTDNSSGKYSSREKDNIFSDEELFTKDEDDKAKMIIPEGEGIQGEQRPLPLGNSIILLLCFSGFYLLSYLYKKEKNKLPV